MANPSDLLALLEQDYLNAKKGGLQDMRTTLIAGLSWETSYWVNLALKWIKQGAPLDKEIVSRLEEISSQKTYSQNIRHTALKLANRWHRDNHT